jgi:hypothetical protein
MGVCLMGINHGSRCLIARVKVDYGSSVDNEKGGVFGRHLTKLAFEPCDRIPGNVSNDGLFSLTKRRMQEYPKTIGGAEIQ